MSMKNSNRNTKIRIYKTINRSIVHYASEIWIMSKKLEIVLEVFEQKILRRIYIGQYANMHGG
jgi:hypothetical protein